MCARVCTCGVRCGVRMLTLSNWFIRIIQRDDWNSTGPHVEKRLRAFGALFAAATLGGARYKAHLLAHIQCTALK